MRFLADAIIHGGIIQSLRSQGHDVLWTTETLPGVEDGVLLHSAQQPERLLLTADLDCGELGFRERFTSHGAVLLRLERIFPLHFGERRTIPEGYLPSCSLM